MSRTDRNYLFSRGDLSSSLRARMRSVSHLIDEIPQDQFLATSVDTLVEHLVAKLSIDPLVLHEDQMAMEHSEIKIDVTGRFEYGGSLDGRAILVDGHQLTFHLPFSGDLELTRFRGHIILCVQGVANVQSTTAVPGGISPADGRARSSWPLARTALA